MGAGQRKRRLSLPYSGYGEEETYRSTVRPDDPRGADSGAPKAAYRNLSWDESGADVRGPQEEGRSQCLPGESPVVTVFNLATYDELVFSCAPREAVIAAYAQSKGDYNTWDYESKYGSLVRYSGEGNRTVSCGDFAATGVKR